MVACEQESPRANGSRRSLAYAAIAMAAAVALVGAGSLSQRSSSSSLSPQQAYLLQMWDRPYVTTTKLWNAAHNDNGLGDSDGDGSSSYETYDTFGHNGGSSLQGEIDSDLKQILPSSELKTSGSSSSWGTSQLADSSWGRKSSNYDWDGPDAHVHSWDDDQQVQMKAELRKMYSKGIDHISKQITAKAEKDAGGGFYSKWAKLAGNKLSKGHKIGLSQNQAKLFKEAEKSEEKEDAKKASYVKAIKSASVKEEAEDKHKDKSAQQAEVKAKIHAADRLAAKLNSHSSEHASKRASSSKEPVAPSEDPGKIGDKSAVKELRKTLSGAKNAAAKAAARKKMAALEQQIKRDFDSVTSYAHKVRTSLPPMKA